MEGLANSFARNPAEEKIMEVIMLLKQGATPEELATSGVPAHLIEQAKNKYFNMAPYSIYESFIGIDSAAHVKVNSI